MMMNTIKSSFPSKGLLKHFVDILTYNTFKLLVVLIVKT